MKLKTTSPRPTSSTPGDFDSCQYSLNGRNYTIVESGYTLGNDGKKQYYHDVKNDQGDYKRFRHSELITETKQAEWKKQ